MSWVDATTFRLTDLVSNKGARNSQNYTQTQTPTRFFKIGFAYSFEPQVARGYPNNMRVRNTSKGERAFVLSDLRDMIGFGGRSTK